MGHTPAALREFVFQRSGGNCQRCGIAITFETFHVAHLRSDAHGGALVAENLEAWCSRCNYRQRADDVRETRTPPREWQLEALDPVVARIMNDGAATVSAAPGAGKTIFTGLVFEALRDADVVDRLVVVAPRRTIVDQWEQALRHACHIELKPFAAAERPGQDGVVITYQSLTEDRLDVHRLGDGSRTMVSLDEVHHLGEADRAAWARSIAELVGSVDPLALRVRGVLNLSGTLWRSPRSGRISTVRYDEMPDGRLVSRVDYEIGSERLIAEGQLRPVDIYRLDARVRVQDWANLQIIESNMADLDKEMTGAALRAASEDPAYRAVFVGSVLDRLEEAHRSLGHYHVKALIVAATQDDARVFRREVDDQMRARGLPPMAEIAISDEPEAKATLERFRRSSRVGVLCTVDMAGEGYDCPDIAVIGYATNKREPRYIRQVAARAMRVTDRERELGIIPARIVAPDAEELVRNLLACLRAELHEIAEEPEGPEREGPGGPSLGPRYVVTEIEPTEETVSIAHLDGEVYEFAIDVVDALMQELERANVQASLAPRILMSLRRMTAAREASRPFDLLGADVEAVRTMEREPEPISIEEECRVRQTFLRRMEGWWVIKGDSKVLPAYFAAEANRAAGLDTKGARETATREQLDRAIAHERKRIRDYCDQSGQVPPRWL